MGDYLQSALPPRTLCLHQLVELFPIMHPARCLLLLLVSIESPQILLDPLSIRYLILFLLLPLLLCQLFLDDPLLQRIPIGLHIGSFEIIILVLQLVEQVTPLAPPNIFINPVVLSSKLVHKGVFSPCLLILDSIVVVLPQVDLILFQEGVAVAHHLVLRLHSLVLDMEACSLRLRIMEPFPQLVSEHIGYQLFVLGCRGGTSVYFPEPRNDGVAGLSERYMLLQTISLWCGRVMCLTAASCESCIISSKQQVFFSHPISQQYI